jgi:thiol:disulfide interchange protein DsbD
MKQVQHRIPHVLTLLMFTSSLVCAENVLSPELAFKPSLTRVGDKVSIQFDIEPNYYLYRNKMAVEVDGVPLLINPVFSTNTEVKNDRFLGQQLVYKNQAKINLLLQSSTASPNIKIKAQGCAYKIGVCYAPFYFKWQGNQRI